MKEIQETNKPIILDCTLRDGGYHNAWDFEPELIQEYLDAVSAAGVDYAEFGFRSTKTEGFRGGCAYSTDAYIGQFSIPAGLGLAVMVNGAELVSSEGSLDTAVLERLFRPASESQVSLVRIAVHLRDFEAVLPAAAWLQERGYRAAINLMQVSDKTADELERASRAASEYPLEVLYFADSFGNMTPEGTKTVIQSFRKGWKGQMGIHTHDSMSRALINSVTAADEGVLWIDGAITGMGRGPGNAKTELLLIEFEGRRGTNRNMTSLLSLINSRFAPLQARYGWGTNAFYFLAGSHGIHPTFVQEMLNDARYQEEDILAVIEHLRQQGGKSFRKHIMESARHFYYGKASGSWSPKELFQGKDVLIIGSGPGTRNYQRILETFIQLENPVVVALNTQDALDEKLVTTRIACHPVRLLVDCEKYRTFPHPLITPASVLPEDIKESLQGVDLLDYGIEVDPERFEFHPRHAVLPKTLVFAYALAAAAGGGARRVLLAGFDGFPAGDPRNIEMDDMISWFSSLEGAPGLLAITPTRYNLPATSVYALLEEK